MWYCKLYLIRKREVCRKVKKVPSSPSFVTSPHQLGLVGPVLHDFAQLREVVVVIDAQEKLGQVGCALVIVLEVGEQLEHLVGLSLEVHLEAAELFLEGLVLHLLFVDTPKKTAKLAAHVEHVEE